MAKVISFSAFKAGNSRSIVDPVVADIVEALRWFGGTAHRQHVADRIASLRTGRTVRATVEVQDEVYAAFHAYLDMAKRRRPTALLDQPLGPDSYRWGLTSAGVELFMVDPRVEIKMRAN